MSAVVTQGPRDLVLAPPPADPWAWWTDALAGRFGRFDLMAPQTGFWRYRPRRSDNGVPCATWYADGAWVALINGQPVEDVAGAWRYCHLNPITAEVYDAVMAGAPWPDEIAPELVAEIGHNTATPEAIVRDEIEAADRAFTAWLAEVSGVHDEATDATAESYRKRFLDFRKRIEAEHKTAKTPALEECRRIDALWITGQDSVKALAQAAQDRVGTACLGYRVKRKEAADRAAQAEREARAAQRAAGQVPPATSFVPKKATGLRKVETAVIDDFQAVLAYFAKLAESNPVPPDLAEACQRCTERMLKAGSAVPGARLEISHRA